MKKTVCSNLFIMNNYLYVKIAPILILLLVFSYTLYSQSREVNTIIGLYQKYDGYSEMSINRDGSVEIYDARSDETHYGSWSIQNNKPLKVQIRLRAATLTFDFKGNGLYTNGNLKWRFIRR